MREGILMRERLSGRGTLVLKRRPDGGGETLIARLKGEGSLWPLFLSAVIHLALLAVCSAPGSPKVNDFTMIDLTVSGGGLPEAGNTGRKAGAPGEIREKQASHSIARSRSPSRETREPERSAASAPSSGMERTTAVSPASLEVPALPEPGSGSSISGGTLATARDGGALGGTGNGDSIAGKGGMGNGEGGGSGGLVEGVMGAPGGPSFAARVSPVYPSFARRIGKEGAVQLRLSLDGSGVLKGVEIVKKAGYGFDEAALAAVRASRYRPAMRYGRPVACRALLSIRFELRE